MKRIIAVIVSSVVTVTAIYAHTACSPSPQMALLPIFSPSPTNTYFQSPDEIFTESLETTHFIIYYTPGYDIIAQEIAEIAESIYDDATSFMMYYPQEKTWITLYSYHMFAGSGGTSQDGSGFYIGCGCPFSTEALGKDHLYLKKAVTHEFNHVLFFQMMNSTTIVSSLYYAHEWVPEGIATYYAQCPYVMLGEESMLPLVVQYFEETNSFPSLEEVTLERYYKLMYPISFSVIQFMIDMYGEEKFYQFVHSLKKWDQTVSTTKNVERALQEALGVSLEEFQEEWTLYIREKYPPVEKKVFTAVQLTQPPHRWVPSSWHDNKILCVSDIGENLDVFVMKPDGTDVQQLTDDKTGDFDPKFSPNGEKVAFTSRRDGYANIYVMNADGSQVTQVTFGESMDIMGSWSPDGKKIAFTSARNGNYDVFIMNADGSTLQQLTSYQGEDGWPVFSPDGKIVFVSDRSGNYDLYIMNADGTGMQQLTQTPEDEHFPQYSPSGRKIAFVSKEERGSEICIMNSDGEGRKVIVSPPTYIMDEAILPISPCYPVWSPEGKEIVFMLGNQFFLVQVPSADSTRTIMLGIVVIGIVILLMAVWLWVRHSTRSNE